MYLTTDVYSLTCFSNVLVILFNMYIFKKLRGSLNMNVILNIVELFRRTEVMFCHWNPIFKISSPQFIKYIMGLFALTLISKVFRTEIYLFKSAHWHHSGATLQFSFHTDSEKNQKLQECCWLQSISLILHP